MLQEILIKSILLRAKELIQTQDRWTQGAYHRFINGKQCYCLTGAITQAADELLAEGPWLGVEASAVVRDEIQRRKGNRFIVSFNDNSTWAEVFSVLEASIASI